MTWRFCLYGFLKNQRYFEPFLILAFMEWGLSFFAIGALVATREVGTNALELLSGALADTWGRRRVMVSSFVAYIGAFAGLALARDPLPLAAAMFLYGVGDAFKSGTHKAMILSWLRAQGRADEKTEVYGVTRSWSKLGSAVGVVTGAAWVLATGDLSGLFWWTLVPYTLDLVNLATYPASLEGEAAAGASPRAAWAHLRETAEAIARDARLKGLLAESSGFMGSYKASKDYLQPVLEVAAAAWIAGAVVGVEDGSIQQTALLIAPVYGGLSVLGAWASRRAKGVVKQAGSKDAAAAKLWVALAVVWAAGLVGALTGWFALLIAGFVVLNLLESVWRPVILARFDDASEERSGATLLSVESQARSLLTMILAPLLGAAVDAAVATGAPDWAPVAGVGLAIACAGAWATRRHLRPGQETQ
jgi:MFS family permease